MSATRGEMREEGGEGRARKVDVRLPGKGNSNSHGARPVHLIITMIKSNRTGRAQGTQLCFDHPSGAVSADGSGGVLTPSI